MSSHVPEPFSVSATLHAGTATISPVGEVDLDTHWRVREAIREHIGAGAERVVLDLRKVTFMDPSGLHLVLDLEAESRRGAFSFAIVPGGAEVQRLFDLVTEGHRLTFVEPGDAASA